MRHNFPAIITLLTDFGSKAGYVGAMKGVILAINSKVRLIDISHEVEPQDIWEGALILRNAFHFFPQGTIHLAVVDPGVGSGRKALLVKTKDYFFIAPDNGLISLALREQLCEKIIEITNSKYFVQPLSNTFQGRDIFAPVAAYLSQGVPPEEFGRVIEQWVELSFPTPHSEGGQLVGEIIYVDRFGNLITNITPELLRERGPFPKKCQIEIQNRIIEKISQSYAENPQGAFLAIWGSWGFLEISVNHGDACRILSSKKGDPVRLRLE